MTGMGGFQVGELVPDSVPDRRDDGGHTGALRSTDGERIACDCALRRSQWPSMILVEAHF